MRSSRRGAATSLVEVLGISPHGVWLLLGDREVFLPFGHFPWFQGAPVAHVLNVERQQPHHLYWPDLDIDLHVDSIDHPERYPLLSRDAPITGSKRAKKRGSTAVSTHTRKKRSR